jgi:prepilin-type N-terminal cleavage/methylation domain-containing protein
MTLKFMTAHKKIQILAGFTLIELMIAITIAAVLATIGIFAYTKSQDAAKDAKRKGDVEAIEKAYQLVLAKTGKYAEPQAADFQGNAKPTRPEGGDYYSIVSSDGLGYKVCAALSNNSSQTCNTPADNCYCKYTGQSFADGSIGTGYTGTDYSLGAGGSTPSSCDPNGTLSAGLVGYWKMNEASWNGTAGEVKDSSGRNNNGYAACAGTSCTKPNTFSPSVNASFSRAGQFNGVLNTNADYVLVNDNDAMDIGTGSMSWSMWFKTSKSDEYVLRKSDSSNSNGVIIQLSGAGNIVCTIDGTPNTTVNATTTSALANNAWHQFACVLDRGNKLKLYVDGVFDKEVSATTLRTSSINAASHLYFSYPQLTYPLFNGLIDDVRIYNRVLTASDITALYNSGNGCF